MKEKVDLSCYLVVHRGKKSRDEFHQMILQAIEGVSLLCS